MRSREGARSLQCLAAGLGHAHRNRPGGLPRAAGDCGHTCNRLPDSRSAGQRHVAFRGHRRLSFPEFRGNRCSAWIWKLIVEIRRYDFGYAKRFLMLFYLDENIHLSSPQTSIRAACQRKRPDRHSAVRALSMIALPAHAEFSTLAAFAR